MGSYDFGKDEIVAWVKDNFPKGATCLDVGACDGKWSRLLGDYLLMDAVEIFPMNIINHNLNEKYRNAFCGDVKDLEYEWYDLIIFGDVIEHMTVENAQKVLEYARPRCKDMIVAVPYLYSQGAEYGNPWEVHIQNDLTPEIFNERYPNFKTLIANSEYAYYSKL